MGGILWAHVQFMSTIIIHAGLIVSHFYWVHRGDGFPGSSCGESGAATSKWGLLNVTAQRGPALVVQRLCPCSKTCPPPSQLLTSVSALSSAPTVSG